MLSPFGEKLVSQLHRWSNSIASSLDLTLLLRALTLSGLALLLLRDEEALEPGVECGTGDSACVAVCVEELDNTAFG